MTGASRRINETPTMTSGSHRLQRVPYIASLRRWELEGFPNRRELRAAIRRGELRAVRTGKRTIRVTLPDLLSWLEQHRVLRDGPGPGEL